MTVRSRRPLRQLVVALPRETPPLGVPVGSGAAPAGGADGPVARTTRHTAYLGPGRPELVRDRVRPFGSPGSPGIAALRESRMVVRPAHRPVRLDTRNIESLGDGAVRLLGVAVALANSRDGFLLIDEAENGIHHSLQRDFWRMVLQTARDHNVQVLATTHGWDCVRGFAQAATDLDTVHGALFRLERDGHRTRVVEYREDELAVAARDGIEVR